MTKKYIDETSLIRRRRSAKNYGKGQLFWLFQVLSYLSLMYQKWTLVGIFTIWTVI